MIVGVFGMTAATGAAALDGAAASVADATRRLGQLRAEDRQPVHR